MIGRGSTTGGTGGPVGARLTLRGGPPQGGWLTGLLLRGILCALLVLLVGTALVLVGHVEHTYGSHHTSVPARPARVAVVDLAANRLARGRPPEGLARWQEAAGAEGLEIEHRILESLAGLDVGRYGAVLLLEQERLADTEWDRVVGLLSEGVGVILTGHPGVQHQDGKRRQRVLLESIFPGAQFQRQRRARDQVRVALGGPLVAGFDPGELLALRPVAGALALRDAGSLGWGADGADAALAHGRIGYGPVAWIAPGAASFLDPAQGRRLLRNALRYAVHEPVLELRPWPDGVVAAALIGADAEVLASLAAAGVHPSVLPAAEPASDRDLRLARLLAQHGRVEREGGLYAPSSANGGLDDPDPRLERELREELRRRNVWVAHSGELASWWQRRRRLVAELEESGAGRVRVVLHNAGRRPIERATARVYLPPGARAPTGIESASFGGRPVMRVGSTREWVDVIVPEIEAGESVRYSIRY